MFRLAPHLNSIRTVGLLATCVLVVSMAVPVLAADPPDKPLNFVILLADDLGWTDLGSYGSDLHVTPNLDRLAAESVKFTDAYAAASVCSPTRASILTGKYPARLRMTIWRESSGTPPLKRPVSTIDFYPTIQEMARLKGDAQHNAEVDDDQYFSLPFTRRLTCLTIDPIAQAFVFYLYPQLS